MGIIGDNVDTEKGAILKLKLAFCVLLLNNFTIHSNVEYTYTFEVPVIFCQLHFLFTGN